jgi:hypothetical protein
MKPRFKFLTGDINWQQYGGTWLSQKLNNGEFDYWLAIRVINWEDSTGEKPDGNTYNVELLSVSPSEAGPENLKRAFECIGQENSDESILDNPVCQCDALLSYGVYAHLWSADGKNINKLMREVRKQALVATSLYGFYMDRAQNRIGDNGWDFQRGQIGRAIGLKSVQQ